MSTRSVGIDIGSRTTKVAFLEDGRLTGFGITETGIFPLKQAEALLAGHDWDRLTATGYGRHLAHESLDCPVITEIKAYALGARHFFPNCRTVIDVGGQDSKAIRVGARGHDDFEMNDRCAAGTGKFLEVMAHTLGSDISDFGKEALKADRAASISSMCTVFAESEVVSLIARGEKPANIALGLHESILNRLMTMLGRVGTDEDIVFAGGVAKNPCMVTLLQRRLGKPVLVPEEPQIVGAVGAALSANRSPAR